MAGPSTFWRDGRGKSIRDGGAVDVLEGWKGEEHARRSEHSGSAGDTGNLEANTASMHFWWEAVSVDQ
ncbi:unnamed protein product [Chondrus crispus]|uniref:Uncharacterized protein n=1 Tax=Chondrus crispus TaxID=2769 RepID=R7QM58_CHOCR|nr:unnamed protein product [Chondrus crispus]CDF38556.1 unnamed protein product [Chondrus crispus]|eukprot:XP_005718449.1 unnamed protein product [Chondrus crispus]